MKTTGIVRRVDDLGRIVIPREYRRAYDINIGDPMEIIADSDGNILLKRVDISGEFKRCAENVAVFLSEQFGWTVAVCDRSKFLTAYGRKKSAFLGATLSDRLISVVGGARRTTVLATEVAYLGLGEQDFSVVAVEPIISERGVLGGLIVASNAEFSPADAKIITLSARLIGNNMQKY